MILGTSVADTAAVFFETYRLTAIRTVSSDITAAIIDDAGFFGETLTLGLEAIEVCFNICATMGALICLFLHGITTRTVHRFGLQPCLVRVYIPLGFDKALGPGLENSGLVTFGSYPIEVLLEYDRTTRKEVGDFFYIKLKQRGNILLNDIKLGLQNTLAVENNPVFLLVHNPLPMVD